eukprot:gene6972-gene7663
MSWGPEPRPTIAQSTKMEVPCWWLPSEPFRHKTFAGCISPWTSVHGVVFLSVRKSCQLDLFNEASTQATKWAFHLIPVVPSAIFVLHVAHAARARSCSPCQRSWSRSKKYPRPRSHSYFGINDSSRQNLRCIRAICTNVSRATSRYETGGFTVARIDAKSFPQFKGDPGPKK